MTTSSDWNRDSNEGGIIPGSAGHPAFTLYRPRPAPVPILIAVPHAGRHYPSSLTELLRMPDAASLRLEDRLVDLVAKAVARETGASLLIAHAPRAMIDLNRSAEDMDWSMVASQPASSRPRLAAGRRSRSGLGLVPRRLPGMGELWRRQIAADDLNARITQVHQPYHQALSETFAALRDRWGTALLLDLHSMPPLGPKHGNDAAADFVLGDRFGAACDNRLVRAALDELQQAGRRAAHNRPYAGGYVLDRHGIPARGLNAMQVEICRSAYLDKSLREAGEGLPAIIEIMIATVRRLS